MHKSLTILLLFIFQITNATQTPWNTDPNYDLKTRIISTHNSIPHNNQIQTAIEFQLNNWKIYGQKTTDIGQPTTLTIQQTKNLKSYNITYPKTTPLNLLGITSQAYQKHIAFPINITAKNPQQPITINATANFLACDELCIPITHDFTLTLTPTDPQKIAAIDTEATKIYQQFSPNHQQSFYKQNNIWLIVIAFSIIGGLILNIMPCVLPALALKAFALSKHQNKIAVRKSCLATALGIITCFLIIGIAIAIIKLFGAEIGWGIQYQQPAFLSALFMVMILVSASLFGWIQPLSLPLPNFLSKAIKPTTNAPSFQQDFMLGVLATILATPCTAPFLSTAVAAAMIVGGFEALLIFFGLGLGMALPYLMVAAIPQTAKIIPKPGRWMIFVKSILSLLLLLTCAWLLWLLSVSHSIIIAFIIAIMGIAAVGYLYLRQKQILVFKTPAALLPSMLIIGGVLLSFAPVPPPQDLSFAKIEDSYESQWQDFNEADIAEMVNSGKIVFVDVTAKWCITCQFNKFRVLQQSEVRQQLSSENVILMRADWTLPDDSITRYLRKAGRAGVPMNVVYGANARQGILLSEILSVEEVLSALQQAGE